MRTFQRPIAGPSWAVHLSMSVLLVASATFAVKGHLFGLALNAEDKRALIAFLRTL